MGLERVLVFGEQEGGSLASAVLELLAGARALSGAVDVVAFGAGAASVAEVVGEHGAATLHAAVDPEYDEVLAGAPAADATADLVRRQGHDLVLVASTYAGRDFAGRLAAQLGAPLVANALDIVAEPEIAIRSSIFGAALDVTTTVTRTPAVVLVRPRSFVAASVAGGAATVVPLDAPVAAMHRAVRRVERRAEAAAGPQLEEATLVVSGGRGLGDPKNFALVEELAQLLGGAVGASRAVVDAGWVPYALQVGQTGKTVKPSIYIACGISGAMQHTVGMKGAKHIIAINRDSEASIFKIADLGVVGDVLKILPQLIDEVRARRPG